MATQKKLQPSSKRTSEILEAIMKNANGPKGKKISVGDFTKSLSDRVFGIAIILFGLINAIIPGVSVIFAVPILLICGQMILGHHQIWLPRWISEKTFSESIIRITLRRILPTLKFMEKFISPRLLFLTSHAGEKFIAIIIAALAFVVFLPIPGLNFFPSMCMCILALGILERDGMLVMVGIIVSIFSIWLVGWAVVKASIELYTIITGWISAQSAAHF